MPWVFPSLRIFTLQQFVSFDESEHLHNILIVWTEISQASSSK